MSNKTCPSCNHDVTGKNKFCPNCGVPLTKSAREKTNSSGKKTKANPNRDYMIIVGILAVIIVGYFIVNKPAQKPIPQQQAQIDPNSNHPEMEMDGSMMGTMPDMPTDYNGLVNIGNQSMDAGNFPMAAEAYGRALRIDGSSSAVRTDYGSCLHGMGLAERAIEEFAKVIKVDPGHLIATFNTGIAYSTMQQKDSAIHYWKKVIMIDSNSDMAKTAQDNINQFGG